ncbi:MAG: SIMPL domain-containing protein [Anaerolineales bacterium]|jgi:uncharacterized protein YggE
MNAFKHTAVATAFLCLFLTAVPAIAQDNPDREVTVYGTGILEHPPTILVFRVELGAVAPKAQEATDHAQQRMDEFIEDFRRFGLTPEDWIQDMALARRPLRDEPKKLAFWATGILTVFLDEFGSSVQMLDRATAMHASDIHFHFELDEPQIEYERALKRALADAHFKADALAKEVGLSVGSLLSCEELSEPPGLPLSDRHAFGGAQQVSAEGMETVTARAVTEFRYQHIVTTAKVRARFGLTD